MERQSFGYTTAWLAFETTDGDAVARALRLTGVAPAPWAAVGDARGSGIFVTPEVRGWTLATGGQLLQTSDADLTDVAQLSVTLECEAQFFVSHRDVDAYGWYLAAGGELHRAFAVLGADRHVLHNEGNLTDAEIEAGVPSEGDAPPGTPLGELVEPGGDPVDEDTVLAIAGSWSIDPVLLRGDDDREGRFGQLPGVEPPARRRGFRRARR